MARAGVQDVRQLGVVFTAARELTLLQHLHHHYRPCLSAQKEVGAVVGECPYFIAPVGVLTLSPGDFGRTPALRRALLGDAATDGDVGSGDHLNSRAVGCTSPSQLPRHDLHYLAFPAVHLSLSRVLGLNTPTSSPRWELTKAHLENNRVTQILQLLQGNRGHLLPAAFAVDLVRDLLLAVHHMIAW